MMMIMDKKKTLNQILGPEEVTSEGGGDSALHAMASELIDAVNAKDVDGVVESLRACYAEIANEPKEE